MRKMTSTWMFCAALVLGLVAAPLLAPSTEAEDSNADKERGDAALYAVGSISAADLLTTYIFIGSMGDSFARKGHNKEQVQKLIKPRANLNGKGAQALARLMDKPGMTLGDKTHLAGVNEAYELLTKYANALIAMTEAQTPENAKAFDTHRKAAWAKISSVLGIEK